jgi:hypothetical protein
MNEEFLENDDLACLAGRMLCMQCRSSISAGASRSRVRVEVEEWLRDSEEPELPPVGGRTPAGVVRIGNTVRRPLRERATFVLQLAAAARLLRRLHDRRAWVERNDDALSQS